MKKRILIVDDDIMTLKLLKKNLEETYDVVTENAGYRFVEKMETYEADLILLDIEMLFHHLHIIHSFHCHAIHESLMAVPMINHLFYLDNTSGC